VFDWLFEGRVTVYGTLLGLTILLLVLWWQSRKRSLLLAVAAVGALIGLYAFLDHAIETDREQLTRKVKEMAAALNAGDVDRAFVHISDRFRSAHGIGKEDLRKLANDYLKDKRVTSVDVWDIECEDAISREHPPARVSFMVKVHGQPGFEGAFARCDSTFDFDPQHGWRLSGFRLFKPQSTEEWGFQV
jgi:hypothetical protein